MRTFQQSGVTGTIHRNYIKTTTKENKSKPQRQLQQFHQNPNSHNRGLELKDGRHIIPGMNPLSDLFSGFEKIITEHGSAVILRERLALLKEKTDAVIAENSALKEKVADLEINVSVLTSSLRAKAKAEEFVEHRGAHFKQNVAGGFHRAVYCPICHNSTAALVGEMPFACRQQCGWMASFNGDDLGKIMAELSA